MKSGESGMGYAISMGVLLFIIIYLAVRLAITPLIDRQEDEADIKDDISLVDLRDMNVITSIELEDIMRLYQSKVLNDRGKERYIKYSKVLTELKDIGYFNEDTLNEKLDILKSEIMPK